MSGLLALMRWISSLLCTRASSSMQVRQEMPPHGNQREKLVREITNDDELSYLMKRLYAEGTLWRFSAAAAGNTQPK